MRIREFATNFRLATNTVSEHIGDNPVLLVFQVLNRMPTRVRRVVAGSLRKIPSGLAPSLRTIGAAVEGDTEAVQKQIDMELSGKHRSSVLLKFSDILLSSGQSEQAAELLELADPNSSKFAESKARLQWHVGDMSGAVETLKSSGKNTAVLGRLSSELRSFQGEALALEPVAEYQPVENRILFSLTNSLPETGSGYAQRSHSILKHLADAGWEVSATTRLGWPVLTGSIFAKHKVSVEGIKYVRQIPKRSAQGFDRRLQQQAEMMLKLVLEYRPAIIHTTTHWTNGLVAQAVADAVGIPWVYEVRGQLADTWASTRGPAAVNSERYRLFNDREAEVTNNASMVVTLGERMKDQLVKQGTEPEKISICGNAVGDSFLEAPSDPLLVRQQLGLDPELNYMGTVSSIVKYEGLDLAVRVMHKLADSHPKLRLLIAGDGEALPSLLGLVEELGIRDKVITTGRVPREKARLYHQALDIFIVPRIDSTVTRSVTPMKSVEASATAKPVLASDLPALGELVSHGNTGYLLPAGDETAWAETITTLLEDPDLRATLGRNAREWALSNRTWQANTLTYEKIYNQILHEKQANASS